MIYSCNYSSEQFDLRDCYWEFLSVKDGTLTVVVNAVNVLSGEYRGEIIDAAVVTFRGFHLTWIERIEGEEQIRISEEEGLDLLAREPYFVFSYWNENLECEMAGLAEETFAMLFTYDSAEISWDCFKERSIGTLIRTE